MCKFVNCKIVNVSVVFHALLPIVNLYFYKLSVLQFYAIGSLCLL